MGLLIELFINICHLQNKFAFFEVFRRLKIFVVKIIFMVLVI